jgi:hypothetical protein
MLSSSVQPEFRIGCINRFYSPIRAQKRRVLIDTGKNEGFCAVQGMLVTIIFQERGLSSTVQACARNSSDVGLVAKSVNMIGGFVV